VKEEDGERRRVSAYLGLMNEGDVAGGARLKMEEPASGQKDWSSQNENRRRAWPGGLNGRQTRSQAGPQLGESEQ